MASHQRVHGRYFLLLAQSDGTTWARKDVVALSKAPGVSKQSSNLQTFGNPYTRTVTIMHHLPVAVLSTLMRGCPRVKKPPKHTRLEFPDRFCHTVSQLLCQLLCVQPYPAGTRLLMDVVAAANLQDTGINNLMYFPWEIAENLIRAYTMYPSL